MEYISQNELVYPRTHLPPPNMKYSRPKMLERGALMCQLFSIANVYTATKQLTLNG